MSEIDWCKAYAEYLKKSGLFKGIDYGYFDRYYGQVCDIYFSAKYITDKIDCEEACAKKTGKYFGKEFKQCVEKCERETDYVTRGVVEIDKDLTVVSSLVPFEIDPFYVFGHELADFLKKIITKYGCKFSRAEYHYYEDISMKYPGLPSVVFVELEGCSLEDWVKTVKTASKEIIKKQKEYPIK